VTVEAYGDSLEHLWDELARIDQLVRAQTVRWRLTVAATKPAHLWGMVHVTDEEVQAYLDAGFLPPDRPPPEVEAAAAPYLAAAAERRDRIDARRQATPSEVVLRLDRLVTLFQVGERGRDGLLVCLLPELDPRYRRLYGYLQDECSRTSACVELILQILAPLAPGGAGRDPFEGDAPLVDRRLVVLADGDHEPRPLPARPVRVDDRVVAYLLGDDTPDRRLAAMVTVEVPQLPLDNLLADPDQRQRLQRLAGWIEQRQTQQQPPPTLLLHGPRGSGRLQAARALCTTLELPLLVADLPTALQLGAPLDQLIGLCYREAALRGAAVYWAGGEALLEPGQRPDLGAALLDATEGTATLALLATTRPWDPTGRTADRPLLRLDFRMPAYELRQRLWTHHLPPAEEFADPPPDRAALAELLANGFQLTPGQIADAAAVARADARWRDPLAPALSVEDLYQGCRRQSERRLSQFARRVEPRAGLTFDDLVLPPSNRRQLDELRDRIRLRSRLFSELGFERRIPLGRGLLAMFTGPSGTGKTMAAELLANEQGVDLYKVDLSAVVSKYVGDTEKNLGQVFTDAGDANAMLFFDECESMFGKRGEVRDARDRWANCEVDYLLQRIEQYQGPVVLASNRRQDIDEAFVRRIHLVVEFPFPDAEARLRIWAGMFPAGVERPSDEELRALAERFRFAGGNIKNIVIDAAFRALAEQARDDGRPRITLGHLVLATAREYQKLGKPITKGEFGEEFHDWITERLLQTPE
jgi:AAA+ superfamily predicted ATPase